MRKWLIIIIVIVVLIATFMLRMGANQRKGQREEVSNVIPVEVVPAIKGNVQSTCEILGTIMADKTAQVLPRLHYDEATMKFFLNKVLESFSV